MNEENCVLSVKLSRLDKKRLATIAAKIGITPDVFAHRMIREFCDKYDDGLTGLNQRN